MEPQIQRILFHRHTALLFFGTIISHTLSFWIHPNQILSSLIASVISVIFCIITVQRTDYGCLFLMTEYLLGSSGHIVELHGISLRLLLTVLFLCIWICKQSPTRLVLLIRTSTLYSTLVLMILVVTGYAGIVGIINNHPIHAVIQDIIPFLFFFLLFPIVQLWKQLSQYKEYMLRLLIACVCFQSIFAISTFSLFSFDISVLQAPYYKWIRDVLAGKITDIGNHFFRVVTPSHVLLIPILLINTTYLLFERYRAYYQLHIFFILLSLIPLITNVSRTYAIGIGAAYILLFAYTRTKRCLIVCGVSILCCLIGFTSLSYIASRGTNFGLSTLGFRFGTTIVAPHTEESAFTRTTLLQPIFSSIQEHPLSGNGLGQQLTFLHPYTHTPITTNQFDWGYFELWSEMGIGAILLYTMLIAISCKKLFDFLQTKKEHPLVLGVLISLLSVSLMQGITPLYSHVFGILMLVAISSVCVSLPSITMPTDQTVDVLS